MSMTASIHERLHRALVFHRRRDRLVAAIDDLLPPRCRVLDIGCGNGEIGMSLAASGRDVAGVETLARASCQIPMTVYDGNTLPFPDGSFDWAVIVDVLHHTADPDAVIGEALRVATRGIVVKDHTAESARHRWTLGAMDWVGNRQFGVGRDGGYLTRLEWSDLWQRHGVEVTAFSDRIDLYPLPLKPIIEHGLHFVARLEPVGTI